MTVHLANYTAHSTWSPSAPVTAPAERAAGRGGDLETGQTNRATGPRPTVAAMALRLLGATVPTGRTALVPTRCGHPTTTTTIARHLFVRLAKWVSGRRVFAPHCALCGYGGHPPVLHRFYIRVDTAHSCRLEYSSYAIQLYISLDDFQYGQHTHLG